jgi:hypothetical protein
MLQIKELGEQQRSRSLKFLEKKTDDTRQFA